MRLKLWVFVILACAAAPSATAGKKPAGKVLDVAALSKVRTYCVDTSKLSGGPIWPESLLKPEAFDVRKLIKRESGPNGLVSKLPWKLEPSCPAAGVDAVASFNFFRVYLTMLLKAAPLGYPAGREWPPPGTGIQWRARLQISEGVSSRIIYEAEGNALDYPPTPNALTQEEL